MFVCIGTRCTQSSRNRNEGNTFNTLKVVLK